MSISLDEAKEAIAALGRERGFITSEELLNGVPELDLSPQQIEEFLADVQDHLRGEGIEILEVPGEELNREEGSTATRELLGPATYDPVRMYLKEIAKIPLLTAAQEVDLAMRIEGGELAVELLASLELTHNLDQNRFRRVVQRVVRILKGSETIVPPSGQGLVSSGRAFRLLLLRPPRFAPDRN